MVIMPWMLIAANPSVHRLTAVQPTVLHGWRGKTSLMKAKWNFISQLGGVAVEKHPQTSSKPSSCPSSVFADDLQPGSQTTHRSQAYRPHTVCTRLCMSHLPCRWRRRLCWRLTDLRSRFWYVCHRSCSELERPRWNEWLLPSGCLRRGKQHEGKKVEKKVSQCLHEI